jgi:hypothetical protein
MMPTYGTCVLCGAYGPFASVLFADAPPETCTPCSVVVVAERSSDLAVLFVADAAFVGLLTDAEVAALN